MYTAKLGDKICEATATSSIGLRHICKQLKVPYSTVTDWIYNKEHEFRKKYAHAKVMQLNHLAEEILEIADDSTNDYMTIVKNGKKYQVQNREAISRSRLRIQARMNLISKLAPILREYQAGKDADKPEKIVIRRVPYPHETPEEYAESQRIIDEQDALRAKQAQKAGNTKNNVKKNRAEAYTEEIAYSSPENTPEPAMEEPLTKTRTQEKPLVDPDPDAPYRREREELFAAFNARQNANPRPIVLGQYYQNDPLNRQR